MPTEPELLALFQNPTVGDSGRGLQGNADNAFEDAQVLQTIPFDVIAANRAIGNPVIEDADTIIARELARLAAQQQPGGSNVSSPFDFDFGTGGGFSGGGGGGFDPSGGFNPDPSSGGFDLGGLGGTSSGGSLPGGSADFFGQDVLQTILDGIGSIPGIIGDILGGIFGGGDDGEGGGGFGDILGSLGGILQSVLGGGSGGAGGGGGNLIGGLLQGLLGSLGGIFGGGQAEGGALVGGLLSALFGDRLNRTESELKVRLPEATQGELELLGINLDLARRQLDSFAQTQGTQGIQNQALQSAFASLQSEQQAADQAANAALAARGAPQAGFAAGAAGAGPVAPQGFPQDLLGLLPDGESIAGPTGPGGQPAITGFAADGTPRFDPAAFGAGDSTFQPTQVGGLPPELGGPSFNTTAAPVDAFSTAAPAPGGGVAALRGQEIAASLLDQERQRQLQNDAASVVLQQLQNGGVADPETVARIQAIADLNTQSALSDLSRFGNDTIEQIRLASARRGLQASDTPILNRFDDFAAEQSRLAEQTIRAIRQRALEQELTFPLQQGALGTSQLGALSNSATNARALNDAISRAGQDRTLGLAAQAGQTGLGLSSSSRPQQTLGLAQDIRSRQATQTATGSPSALDAFSNTSNAIGSAIERFGLFGNRG